MRPVPWRSARSIRRPYGLMLLFCVLMLLNGVARSATAINKTRLIVDATHRQTSLLVTNEGQGPLLIQTWVDPTADNANPSDNDLPVVIDPPIFRLEAAHRQAVHVLLTGVPPDAPRDRESVYYFNLLEIPPRRSSGEPESRELQFAVRSRLKLFYRPADLPDYDLAGRDALRFSLQPHDGGFELIIQNPAPVHRTLARLVLEDGETQHVLNLSQPMIAPETSRRLDLPGDAVSGNNPTITVQYRTINDLGGLDDGTRRITLSH